MCSETQRSLASHNSETSSQNQGDAQLDKQPASPSLVGSVGFMLAGYPKGRGYPDNKTTTTRPWNPLLNMHRGNLFVDNVLNAEGKTTAAKVVMRFGATRTDQSASSGDFRHFVLDCEAGAVNAANAIP